MMNYPYYNNYFNQQPQQDERIWVQGIEGANAYLVAPNSFVRLWDSQNNVYYEKRTDATGRPYTEVYEYAKKDIQKPRVGPSYDSQLEELSKRITALEKRYGGDRYESNADDPTV